MKRSNEILIINFSFILQLENNTLFVPFNHFVISIFTIDKFHENHKKGIRK